MCLTPTISPHYIKYHFIIDHIEKLIMRKRNNEGNFIAVFRAWDDFADFLHDST